MKWIEDLSTRVPIANWAPTLEGGALAQAKDLANLSYVVDHVALMPDCHPGKGMPIGGVIACKDTVVPNAVGVDIGCGMGFVETDIRVSDLTEMKVRDENLIRVILKTIRKVIPTGFAHHMKPQDSLLLDSPSHDVMEIEVIKEELNKARYQVGTLGGGNHFIELQVTTFKDSNDSTNNLCIMLHSGSRNFGYRIANHFNQLAQALGGFVYKGDEGLAHFDVNSEFGQQYIRAMNFALDFAKENRRVMMERIKNVVFNLIRKHTDIGNINILSEANIHHNYAALEQHYGEDVWVHRKGAICMSEGSVGIIPGSMGTPSYIVEGKGNKESFNSASHGSGRIMGRGAFNRQYSLEQAEKSMEGVEYLGWSTNRKGRLDLSEAPAAYKDIEAVIEAESDLINIKIKLKPIGSVKG
jgi:tRNA-splicing ligase RtcB